MNFQPSYMNESDSSIPIDNEHVRLHSIQQQIETILSIEDMAQTVVLPSYMTEDGFISIPLLIQLFQLNLSGISVQDVINACKDSNKVVVDVDMCMIRPNIPVERKTIILRDLDDKVTEDDIRTIFEGIDSIATIKPPVGNNWFIVMDTEEHALNALRCLQAKQFKDQPIHARIKNESRVMTINRLVSAQLPEMDNMNNGSLYFGSFNPNSTSVFSSASMTSTPSVEFDHVSKNPKRRSKNRQQNRRNRVVTKPIPLPQLSNKSAFPPLVFTGSQNVGYSDSYIHYSSEEILSIIKGMTELSLPQSPEEDMSSVLTKEPNYDLVSKQRTVSIDQSLEAGMPRTYSVDSVDYTTMLVGDMEEEVKEEVRKKRKDRKQKKLDYSKIIKKGVSEKNSSQNQQPEKGIKKESEKSVEFKESKHQEKTKVTQNPKDSKEAKESKQIKQNKRRKQKMEKDEWTVVK